MLRVFSNQFLLAVVVVADECPAGPRGGFVWCRQDRRDHASVARGRGLAV